MDREKSRTRVLAESIGIVVALVFCLWMIFGKTLMTRLQYAGTKLSYAVETNRTAAGSAVRAHMEKSLLWKCYFAHLPGQDESAPLIAVSVTIERSLIGPPVNEPNRYNSSGHVEATLTVAEKGTSERVYAKTLKYNLPAVFTFTSEATGNGQEDVFRDTERKAVDEVVAYLAVAALRSMSLRPDRAAQYAPMVVKSLGDNQIVVYEAAAKTLCAFGPAAKSVEPDVKKLLKKRRDVRAQRALQRVLKSMGSG
ncbi:MAG: hypothetical protein HQ559_05580 [Lentisphaerae bacterium]|nr:hypothetical protein [Lentisphaerota bacterium]